MLKSSYSDAYILVKGKIEIAESGSDAAARQIYERSKRITFKNYAPFTDCISKINNIQVDNAKDLDVVMPMRNLIEYSDNYSKKIWKSMAILQRRATCYFNRF